MLYHIISWNVLSVAEMHPAHCSLKIFQRFKVQCNLAHFLTCRAIFRDGFSFFVVLVNLEFHGLAIISDFLPCLTV